MTDAKFFTYDGDLWRKLAAGGWETFTDGEWLKTTPTEEVFLHLAPVTEDEALTLTG